MVAPEYPRLREDEVKDQGWLGDGVYLIDSAHAAGVNANNKPGPNEEGCDAAVRGGSQYLHCPF
jgi:hypothetical protein